MGNGLVKREIAEDMKALDGISAPAKCEGMVKVMTTAIKRALRVAEMAYSKAYRTEFMLGLLIVLVAKDDVWRLILWFAQNAK